jgi:hypothetical protein
MGLSQVEACSFSFEVPIGGGSRLFRRASRKSGKSNARYNLAGQLQDFGVGTRSSLGPR